MSAPSLRQDLRALRNLIEQADLVLATIAQPEAAVRSARESLTAASALSKDLANRAKQSPLKASAVALGAKGGLKTAERGPEYYSQIAAMRKNRKGGRPRKIQ
jgi:hypothetical protein